MCLGLHPKTSQSIPNLSLPLPSPTLFFLTPCTAFLLLFLSCWFHIWVGKVDGWEVPWTAMCVWCCFSFPSSIKHREMRSGSGLGSELGKARSSVCFSCPPASVSHHVPYTPESVCVCGLGRAPSCSHRLLTSFCSSSTSTHPGVTLGFLG